jgi:signal recognition particle GTPase
MDFPTKQTEAELWPTARDIVHFVGMCGAGKSTLSSRLAARVARHGGKVIGTIDYYPHTPDHERAADRAFSRELDRRNIEADCTDPAVHQGIVDHTLASLSRWVESDANVVLVDRWHESYDNLPSAHVEYIEAASLMSTTSTEPVMSLWTVRIHTTRILV